MQSNEANYAKLGFFIIVCAALIVGALVWFGGAGGNKHEYLIETYFSDPVSGLDVGSAVNFRGVRVGSVKRISFIGAIYPAAAHEDYPTIWVQLAIDSRLFGFADHDRVEDIFRDMIAKGIHATVSASGVTGLSRIEMNYPKTEIEDKKISWQPHSICVPPAPSILQSAADSAQRILNQIDRMDLVEAWTNFLYTIKSAGNALDHASALLDSQRGNITDTLDNLRDASASFRSFAETIRGNPSLLLRDQSPKPLDETH